MLSYRKFFEYTKSMQLDTTQLRKMFTPRVIYRLENGSEISAYIIDKICHELKCQPGDIMEYVEDTPDK